MPLNLPTKKENTQKAKTDFQRETGGNPLIRNSFIGALVVSAANRAYDFFLQLKILEQYVDWSRATGTILTIVASWFGVTKNPATQSTGNFVVQGTLTTAIPINESVTSGGVEYLTTAAVSIVADNIAINSLTQVGGVATAVTDGPHGLASNISVTVSGANEAGFNLTEVIDVVDDETFTYPVDIATVTPATGTTVCDFETASVPVQSVDFQTDDLNVNQDAGAPVTFAQPISGVNNTGWVDFGQIGGGSSIESDEDFRARFLDRVQNPVAHFNSADITQQAKQVAGVTRVFVDPAGTVIDNFSITDITLITSAGVNLARYTTALAHGIEDGFRLTTSGAVETEYNVTDAVILVEDATHFVCFITGTPASPATGTFLGTATVSLGQVRIFFTRDNDADIIPSASEITTVKDKILEITPANTSDDDVIMPLLTGFPVDFTFTALSPNTTTMKTSVTNKLTQFFRQNTIPGGTVEEDDYKTAINTTIDETTGQGIQSFTLSVPSGDVTVGSEEIAILGNITYSV